MKIIKNQFAVLLMAIVLLTPVFISFKKPVGDDYKPSSPLIFASSDINEATVKAKMAQNHIRYTQNDIDKLNGELREYQTLTDKKIRDIESNISSLSLSKQRIYTYQDVTGIRKQISLLDSSLAASKKELSLSLEANKRSGIFLVVINKVPDFQDKSQSSRDALYALSNKAIADLVGTFIQSETKVANNATVSDMIHAHTKGRVISEGVPMEIPMYSSNRFVYVSRIGVNPLNSQAVDGTSSFPADEEFKVINLLAESNYATKVSLPDDIMNKVNAFVAENKDKVLKENSQYDDIWQNNRDERLHQINKIETDISDNQNRLKEKISKLKEILANETHVSFTENDIEGCVKKAIAEINNKIIDLDAQWNTVRENELQMWTSDVVVEGDPITAIAQKFVEKYGHIKDGPVTKIQKLEEAITVENQVVTKYHEGSRVDVYRKVNNVWLYPIPKDDGTFSLAMVVNFKLEGSTTPKPKTDIPVEKKEGITAYETDFSSNGLFTCGNDNFGNRYLSNGKYVIEGLQSKTYASCIPVFNIDRNGDFEVETTTKWVQGVNDFGYGLVVAYNTEKASFIGFDISANGYYCITKATSKSQSSFLINWTQTKAVNQNAASNTILVRKKGNTISFYCNGVLLNSVQNINLDGNGFGIITEDRQKVEFDNFKIHQISSGGGTSPKKNYFYKTDFISNNPYSCISYMNAMYVKKRDNMPCLTYYPIVLSNDYEVEASMKFSLSLNLRGGIVIANKDKEDIEFLISNEGLFSIYKYRYGIKGQDDHVMDRILSTWEKNAAVNQSGDNKLMVKKSGNEFSFYINDVLVKTITYTDPIGNYIGLESSYPREQFLGFNYIQVHQDDN